MQACFALCVAAALVCVARAECGAYIDHECYVKHSLPESRAWSRILDIDRNRNILFVKDGNTLSQCQLDTRQCNTTTQTWDIRQLAVDQRTGETYGIIQSDRGDRLYKLDLVNNEKELLVDSGMMENIKFKDKLYYTCCGNIMYSYENGKSERVAGLGPYLIYGFIVDKNDDIYFKTNLYITGFVITRLNKGEVDKTVHWNSTYVMTVDKEGNAVFIDSELHTMYRATGSQLTVKGTIDDSICNKEGNCYNSEDIRSNSPLFDKDNNIIYRNNAKNYFYLKWDRIPQSTTIITETILSTPTY